MTYKLLRLHDGSLLGLHDGDDLAVHVLEDLGPACFSIVVERPTCDLEVEGAAFVVTTEPATGTLELLEC